MQKKLTRSREHRAVAGVLGGLGVFFSVDPILLRLGYVLLTVFTGFVPGIVGYVLAAIVVPEEPLIAPSEPIVSDDAETV